MRTEDISPEVLAVTPPPVEHPAQPLPPRALASARVALITTAGLHTPDDRPFEPGAADYRVIPGDVAAGDLRMSHVSVNFDRSGFQLDLNTVFPIDRLRELVNDGVVGSLARWHYSLMGATKHTRLVTAAAAIADLLKADGVTAALLVPV